MKKKVLILSRDFNHSGGVVNYAELLYDNLDRDKFIVEHFVQGKKPGKERLELFQPIFTLYNLFLFLVKLKKFRPDIVHLNSSFQINSLMRDLIYASISKIFDVKTLFYFHGWSKGLSNYIFSKEPIFSKIVTYLLSKQDLITVLSPEFKEILTKGGIEKEKIKLASTMVKPSKYERNDEIFSGEEINIIFCSRIVEEKGIFRLLKSLKHLPPDIYEKVKITYLGSGEALDDLRMLAEGLGLQEKVEIKGYVSEKEKIEAYVTSDIFVFPTYYGEGFPTVILEAMASGLPVITTDIAGNTRAVTDGENGLILDEIPPTPEDIAGKISSMLKDYDYKEISKNNVIKVKENFTVEKVVKMIGNIYLSFDFKKLSILSVGPGNPIRSPYLVKGGVARIFRSQKEVFCDSQSIEMKNYNIRDIKTNLSNILGLVNQIAKNEMIHIHCSFSKVINSVQLVLPLFISKLFEKKILITYHTGYLEDFIRRQKKYLSLLFSLSDRLTVPSQYSKKYLIRNNIVEESKCDILNNFVNPELLSISNEKNIDEVEKNFIIMVIAEINKHTYHIKGVEDFIKMSRSMPEREFILIGRVTDSDLKKKIEEKSGSNLRLTGYIPTHKLARYYEKARIYLQLSMMESFGISTIEAMCFNVIPIAYDRGAAAEVIGDEGYLVKYKDIDEVVNLSKSIFEEKCEKNPRKRVLKNYTQKSYMDEYERVIENII